MGCGNGKVLPEASKRGYVSVVQSLVAFSKAQDDDGPKKSTEKQRGPWFCTSVKNRQPAPNVQQQTLRDGRDRVSKYKDKFDPRVTARYDIRALIGRGSFSRVVRVEHRATRQPFAIKMMEVEAPEGREVCASELAVLQRVSHSNVIQLIEVFQFPRRVYMVLELATGGELLDRVVSRGHFTERDATVALRMVLTGVGYLHNLGITHRDLKPENLLYYHPGADSRLLVTDFGLATFGGAGAGSEVSGPEQSEDGDDAREDRTWSLRTTCGTPEYMAPEVLLRRPYSCAVDMWALGVIAYIVLSGSMPFEDDSRTRLYRSIVRGKYSFHGDPWPSVSNLAKDFIRRLLPLDPTARLTADQAIHHPWVVTMAASSSMRNLHRSISQNLRQRTSRSSSRGPSRTASSGDSSSVGLERAGEKPRAAARHSIWTKSASESHTATSQRAPGASSPSN
ncbi:serine/threonine-protein kinase H1-like [Chaetodon trifascialis]|uniref:serine/threonine-protein kinase H1-like n=1 Tax=Chaetodon trifascialis TaxID=109706 RepID=UPI003992CCE4